MRTEVSEAHRQNKQKPHDVARDGSDDNEGSIAGKAGVIEESDAIEDREAIADKDGIELLGSDALRPMTPLNSALLIAPRAAPLREGVIPVIPPLALEPMELMDSKPLALSEPSEASGLRPRLIGELVG